MQGRRTFFTLTWALVVAAVPARGCPVCDGDTGQQVRAGLVDGNVIPGLLAILLPLAVTLGVAGVVHFGLPGIQARSKHGRSD